MSTQDTATVEQTAEKLEEKQTSEEIEASPVETVEPVSSAETSEDTPTENGEVDTSTFSIHTLRSGQHFTGAVKNVTDFGAFVDIGLPQDGLVHISELAKQKVA